MKEVKSSPLSKARKLPINMSDKRWPAKDGWMKMARNVNGVEIHFVYNARTGKFADFKYK